jgi:hypothetical protein
MRFWRFLDEAGVSQIMMHAVWELSDSEKQCVILVR